LYCGICCGSGRHSFGDCVRDCLRRVSGQGSFYCDHCRFSRVGAWRKPRADRWTDRCFCGYCVWCCPEIWYRRSCSRYIDGWHPACDHGSFETRDRN